MKTLLNYKGYHGSVNFSDENNIFWGKILGITSSISYEGETFSALIEDFHCAVDDYLDICNTELSPLKQGCTMRTVNAL